MVIAKRIKAVILRQLRQERKTSCLEHGIGISTRNCDEICEERTTLVPFSIISVMILLGRERLTAGRERPSSLSLAAHLASGAENRTRPKECRSYQHQSGALCLS